jgi:hypothetical protein
MLDRMAMASLWKTEQTKMCWEWQTASDKAKSWKQQKPA